VHTIQAITKRLIGYSSAFKARMKAQWFAVGISLGGNALMKWAGEVMTAAHKTVNAIASVCAPLDLTASGHAIDSGFNRIAYAKMFLDSMKPRAMAKLAQFPNLFDVQAMQSVTTLFEFDDIFTAPFTDLKMQLTIGYVRQPSLGHDKNRFACLGDQPTE
jgi:uncharacterized protein